VVDGGAKLGRGPNRPGRQSSEKIPWFATTEIVGPTMQNAKSIVPVAGDALPIRLARSRLSGQVKGDQVGRMGASKSGSRIR
jgi:hypothetical protein